LDRIVVEIEGRIELVVPSSYGIIVDVVVVGNVVACLEILVENVDGKDVVMKHVVVTIPVKLDVDEI
jgi:hypothetical protein